MNNASSTLAAAGNTFEQSVALLTAANVTTQNAAKSATGLRTITARLRNTKAELDDLGEAMTSSQYDDLTRALTKHNVALVDMNGEYRSTYDIMKDIAAQWDNMKSMEQSALANLISGTRQQSIFYSLVEQFQEASGAMEAMADSEGELQRANDVYMESITGHINQFKASFQGLSADVFQTDFLTGFVDMGTALINILDSVFKLINALGGLKNVLIGIGGALITLKAGSILSFLTSIPKKISTIIYNITHLSSLISTLSGQFSALNYEGQLLAFTKGAFGALTVGIMGVVAAVSLWKRKQQEAREEAIESANAATSEANELSTLYEEYQNANNALDNSSESKENLKNATDNLITSLQIERGEVQGLIKDYGNLDMALHAKIASEIREDIAEEIAGYDAAAKNFLDVMDHSGHFNNENAVKYKVKSKNAELDQRAIDLLNESGYNVGVGYITLGDIENIDDAVEQYEMLEDIMSRLAENFSPDELKQLDMYKPISDWMAEVKEEAEEYYDFVTSINTHEIEAQYHDYFSENEMPESYTEFAKARNEIIKSLSEGGSLIGVQEDDLDAVESVVDSVLSKMPSMAEYYKQIEEEQEKAVPKITRVAKAFKESATEISESGASILDNSKYHELREWYDSLSQEDKDLVYEITLKTDTAKYGLEDWQNALAEARFTFEDLMTEEAEEGQTTFKDRTDDFVEAGQAIDEAISGILGGTIKDGSKELLDIKNQFYELAGVPFDNMIEALNALKEKKKATFLEDVNDQAERLHEDSIPDLEDFSNLVLEVYDNAASYNLDEDALTSIGEQLDMLHEKKEALKNPEGLTGQDKLDIAEAFGLDVTKVTDWEGTIDALISKLVGVGDSAADSSSVMGIFNAAIAECQDESAKQGLIVLREWFLSAHSGAEEATGSVEQFTEAISKAQEAASLVADINLYNNFGIGDELEILQQVIELAGAAEKSIDDVVSVTEDGKLQFSTTPFALWAEGLKKSLEEIGELNPKIEEAIDNSISKDALETEMQGYADAAEELNDARISFKKGELSLTDQDLIRQNYQDVAELEEQGFAFADAVGLTIGKIQLSTNQRIAEEIENNPGQKEALEAGRKQADKFFAEMEDNYTMQDYDISGTDIYQQLTDKLSDVQTLTDAKEKLQSHLMADEEARELEYEFPRIEIDVSSEEAMDKSAESVQKELYRVIGANNDELKASLDEQIAEQEQIIADANSSGLKASLDRQIAEQEQVVADAKERYDMDLGKFYATGMEDTSKAVFGNIDLNNRQAITWTEELLDKYHDTITSHLAEGESIEDWLGTTSTVIGGSANFDGVEIAFSPMLQGENGEPIPLDKGAVSEYIWALIDEACQDDGGFSTEELLALDARGLDLSTKEWSEMGFSTEGWDEGFMHINGLIADVGDTAIQTGEAMHFLGTDGALNLDLRDIDESQQELDELNNQRQELLQNADASQQKLDELNKQRQELADSGVADANSLYGIFEMGNKIFAGNEEALNLWQTTVGTAMKQLDNIQKTKWSDYLNDDEFNSSISNIESGAQKIRDTIDGITDNGKVDFDALRELMSAFPQLFRDAFEGVDYSDTTAVQASLQSMLDTIQATSVSDIFAPIFENENLSDTEKNLARAFQALVQGEIDSIAAGKEGKSAYEQLTDSMTKASKAGELITTANKEIAKSGENSLDTISALQELYGADWEKYIDKSYAGAGIRIDTNAVRNQMIAEIDALEASDDMKLMLKAELDTKNLDEEIDTFVSDTTTLQEALTNLSNGSFTMSEQLELLQQFPELSGYTGDLAVAIQNLQKTMDADMEAKFEEALNGATTLQSRQEILALRDTIRLLREELDGTRFGINLETEKEGFENITTAIQESASATGLSADMVEKLSERYKGISGANMADVFERTASGIRLNYREMMKLETAYRQDQSDKVNKKLQDLRDQYDELTDAMEKAKLEGNIGEAIDLSLRRDQLAEQINQVSDLASEYAGLLSNYNAWKEAQETPNGGDQYLDVVEGIKKMDELLDNGRIGTDDFKKGLQYFTGEDYTWASTEKIETDYKNAKKLMKRYMNGETNQGAQNFVDDLIKNDLAWVDENDQVTISIEDMDAAAQKLGVSTEWLKTMLMNLEDYNYNIWFDGMYEGMDTITEKADSAAEKLKELGKTDFEFNAGTTDTSSLDAQIEEADRILQEYAKYDENGNVIGFNFQLEGADEAMYLVQALIAKKYEVNKPAILTVDTSGASEEIQAAIEQLGTYYDLLQKAETEKHTTGITAETKQGIKDTAGQLNALPKEVKAQLGLDTEEAQTALENLSNMDVNAEIPQEDLDAITTALQGIDPGTIELMTNSEAVQQELAKVNEYKIDDKTFKVSVNDNATNTINSIKTELDELPTTKTIDINVNYHQTGTKPDLEGGEGDAGADGNAFARGTAFRKGKWGAKRDSEALLAEQGPELLIRGNNYYTVGENGAEFVKVKKGDIIFNAKQTAELLKNGHASSGGGRGQTVGGNPSISTISNEIGSGALEKGDRGDSADGNGPPRLPGKGGSSKGGSSGSRGGGGGGSSHTPDKDKPKKIDWIVVAIDRLERVIENLERVASSAFRPLKTRLESSAEEIGRVRQEIELQQKGSARYLEEAEKVKLPEKLKKLVREGKVDIKKYDAETAKLIERYQKW